MICHFYPVIVRFAYKDAETFYFKNGILIFRQSDTSH